MPFAGKSFFRNIRWIEAWAVLWAPASSLTKISVTTADTKSFGNNWVLNSSGGCGPYRCVVRAQLLPGVEQCFLSSAAAAGRLASHGWYEREWVTRPATSADQSLGCQASFLNVCLCHETLLQETPKGSG